MAENFIRIPPDGAGKKIRNHILWDIVISNPTDNISTLSLGDSIITNTGKTALFSDYKTEFETTVLHAFNLPEPFTVGEILEDDQGNTIGTVDQVDKLFTSNIVVTDAKNPHNSQQIDPFGSAYTRYREGDVQFDAFGNTQNTQASVLDDHLFQYTDNPLKYIDVLENGGTITHNVDASLITLATTTVNASKASRRSKVHYSYMPSQGNYALFAVALGDEGKENVVRRWGLFTETDGMFFALENNQLAVGLRSSASGSVQETLIYQTDWNQNRLLNAVVSPFVIDISKFNIFWMDYQWQGTGRIRFGVFSPNGSRLVVHRIENVNKNILPFTSTGTLPLHLEVENTGISASSSEMKCTCMVMNRQNIKIDYSGSLFGYSMPTFKTVTDAPTYLFSGKLKDLFNGRKNYIGLLPTVLEVVNVDQPIELIIVIDGTLTDAQFQVSPSALSSVDIDEDATAISGGYEYRKTFMGVGKESIELKSDIENIVYRNSLTEETTISFLARTIESTQTSKVAVKIQWKEVK